MRSGRKNILKASPAKLRPNNAFKSSCGNAQGMSFVKNRKIFRPKHAAIFEAKKQKPGYLKTYFFNDFFDLLGGMPESRHFFIIKSYFKHFFNAGFADYGGNAKIHAADAVIVLEKS